MATPTIIKKYSNRRLYDTGESRYVTLDELASKIQGGTDVRVVDAKSNEDLTQATLTQIIIEGRGAAKMLPVPLLTQLIRLGDDALAEFFGRYVTGALELYLQAKRGAQAVAPFNPFATLPFTASDAVARMWMQSPFAAASRAAEPGPPPPAEPDADDEVAALRREMAELRREMREGTPRDGGSKKAKGSSKPRRRTRKKKSGSS